MEVDFQSLHVEELLRVVGDGWLSEIGRNILHWMSGPQNIGIDPKYLVNV